MELARSEAEVAVMSCERVCAAWGDAMHFSSIWCTSAGISTGTSSRVLTCTSIGTLTGTSAGWSVARETESRQRDTVTLGAASGVRLITKSLVFRVRPATRLRLDVNTSPSRRARRPLTLPRARDAIPERGDPSLGLIPRLVPEEDLRFGRRRFTRRRRFRVRHFFWPFEAEALLLRLGLLLPVLRRLYFLRVVVFFVLLRAAACVMAFACFTLSFIIFTLLDTSRRICSRRADGCSAGSKWNSLSDDGVNRCPSAFACGCSASAGSSLLTEADVVVLSAGAEKHAMLPDAKCDSESKANAPDTTPLDWAAQALALEDALLLE